MVYAVLNDVNCCVLCIFGLFKNDIEINIDDDAVFFD